MQIGNKVTTSHVCVFFIIKIRDKVVCLINQGNGRKYVLGRFGEMCSEFSVFNTIQEGQVWTKISKRLS